MGSEPLTPATPQAERDTHWMRLALAQAAQAAQAGEVPVGAVLVRGDELLAAGHNAPISQCDPTAHAEIQVLRQAAQRLGNYRLDDCTLYVTLEPCAMCSGAILHARLGRVVYGAPEPRTGAAGSVLNLFDLPRLNHHTRIESGLLADDCGRALQDFFKPRRINPEPLRDDALRTPAARFADLPDWPWPPQYVADLPSLAGLRLHYVDAGPPDAPSTWLLLPACPGWIHDLRDWIATLTAQGQRVIAVDPIGLGRSDKPKKDTLHHFAWHRQVLLELVERLDLQRVVLLLPAHQAGLGLSLPLAAPARYLGWVLHPLQAGQGAAAQAPFPDRGHQAAVRSAARWLQPGPHEATLRDPLQRDWQAGAGAGMILPRKPPELAQTDWLAALRAAPPWPAAGPLEERPNA